MGGDGDQDEYMGLAVPDEMVVMTTTFSSSASRRVSTDASI